MRNKIIVVIALAATLGSGGLVYARKTADSDIKIDALGAVFGVKTCADLGPATTAGLPVSVNACGNP